MTNKIAQDRKEELLEAILFSLKQEDNWKEDLKQSLHHYQTIQRMKTFDDVANLFYNRFKLLFDEETFEEVTRVDEASREKHVIFRFLDDYGLGISADDEWNGIDVRLKHDGGFHSHHVINRRQGCYQVTEKMVDDLFKDAFLEFIEKDWGFESE